MPENPENTLHVAEDALQSAMVAGNVGELEVLLHPDAVYVGPDGEIADRAADLEVHRSGALSISRLEQLDRRVVSAGGTGSTIVTVDVEGTAGGQSFVARLRYHRAWVQSADGWQVLTATAIALPSDA